MKPVLLAAGSGLMLLIGFPVAVVIFIAAVLAPAAGEQLRAIACAAPATTTPVTPGANPGQGVEDGAEEGGIGFPLPQPGTPRLASLRTAPLPIPQEVLGYYQAAAAAYAMPWTVLAGVGMEETGHGRNTATSTAGARGLMQFMPATWATYGVDGDGDGRALITDPADSVMSAANYLTAIGLTDSPQGVRRALFAYNHADWYVNDVLYYAHAYGGGTVLGGTEDCPAGEGDPALPPLSDARVVTLLTWAQQQIGEPYVFGAEGPDAWDCSSYTRAAFAQIGISIPRTAAAQRAWLAAGNGFRIQPGTERPGDLVFADTYRGPNAIGHVMLVFDPATQTSIEAHGDAVGYASYARYSANHIYEIWRVGDLRDPETAAATDGGSGAHRAADGSPAGEPIRLQKARTP